MHALDPCQRTEPDVLCFPAEEEIAPPTRPRSLIPAIGASPIQTLQSVSRVDRPIGGEWRPVGTAVEPRGGGVPSACGVVSRVGRVRAMVRCGLSVVLGFLLLGGATAAPSGSQRASGLLVLSSLSEAAVPVGDEDRRPVEERSRSSPWRSNAKACSGKRRDRRISEGEASHPPNGHTSPHTGDFLPTAPASAAAPAPQDAGSSESQSCGKGATLDPRTGPVLGPSPGHETPENWGRELRENAAEAFEALVRRHRLSLCAYATQNAAADQAEDVVQDTFLCLWQRCLAKPPPPNAVRWLYRVVRNKALKAGAKARRAESCAPDWFDSLPSPNQQDHATGPGHRWASVCAHLEPAELEILEMRYVERMSHAQISDRTGLPSWKVKRLLGEAKKSASQEKKYAPFCHLQGICRVKDAERAHEASLGSSR
jgi:RNA polymerase sigma factor (sigma-70 family)